MTIFASEVVVHLEFTGFLVTLSGRSAESVIELRGVVPFSRIYKFRGNWGFQKRLSEWGCEFYVGS